MNVFIFTDLEGIRGVSSIGFMEKGSEKYELARKCLTKSLNIAVKACCDAGADKVYYIDGHGGIGGNVIKAEVTAYAVECDREQWQQLLKSGEIDCQIELGSHARAGTINGFLDHTMNSKQWFSYRVNGRVMGELAMHAIVAGKYNVPVVACSGDETACAQAKEYIPNIYTAAVKRASCRNKSEDFDDGDKILENTIKEALANYKKVEIFRVSEPMEVELTFYRTDMCDEAYIQNGKDVERTDARTLKRTVNNLTDYSELKF